MAGNVDLYFLAYNNYYNRIVKKKATIAEYKEADPSYMLHEDVSNYNPGDGCDTKYVCATPGDYTFTKDYCVVTDTSGVIISRWFITEARLLKTKQWEITLHRDVIADYLEDIKNADVFMEKCPIQKDSKFIFNDENILLNEVKEAQFDIKDATGIPWIVGYIAKEKNISGYVSKNNQSQVLADFYVNGIDQWEYYNNLSKPNKNISGFVYRFVCMNLDGLGQPKGYYKYKSSEQGLSFSGLPSETTTTPKSYIKNDLDPLENASLDYTLINMQASYLFAEETGKSITYLNGKKVYDFKNNRLYTLSVTTTTNIIGNYKNVEFGELYTEIYNELTTDNNINILGADASYGTWLAVLPLQNYETLSAVAVVPTTTSEYSISYDRVKTRNTPYDIFCMPYGDMGKWTVGTSGPVYNGNNTKARTLDILSQIAEQPDTVIYDLQLLPYCPLPFTKSGTGSNLTIKFYSEGGIPTGQKPTCMINDTKINTLEHNADGFIGFVLDKDKSTSVSFPDNALNLLFINPIDQKVANLCNKYRLCSPTSQGAFDFSPYKNITFPLKLNIDCTFKPFTPFIQITPSFSSSGLYGGVYKDPRGLICGGNFSLTRTTDAWLQYQLNNKNYQNIFNREIQSLDFRNERAENLDRFSAIMGVISGTASGAASGAMIGGGYGAIIGGAVGLVGSGISGAVDVQVNKELRDEARNLTIDQFGYQLGNIRALPNTLTKIDSFDIKCPIFPYVERYSCSTEEANAVRAKIKFNGMTAGFVSTIKTQEAYKDASGNNNYIKCKLIRLSTTDAEDYHLYNVIADELYAGYYWYSGNYPAL